MSELKAVYATNKDSVTSLYYPKDEADTVIAELKNEADVYKAKYEQEYDIAVHNEKQLSAMRIELRHHKFKRCLAMAKWCHNQKEIYERDSYDWELENDAVATLRNKANIMRKWHKRWLELAEKFKEAK